MKPTVDHLVVAAASLDEGAAFVQAKLGVAMQPGGRHESMGTHNLLLKVGAKCYLEVIAIDPQAQKPVRPRWFGLDTPALRADLQEGPRLLTWVATVNGIDGFRQRAPAAVGSIETMRRDQYAWRIGVPEDGQLPGDGDGLIPTLIEWQGQHPAETLPEQGCALQAMAGAHPRPEQIRRALADFELTGVLPVSQGIARLAVRIITPFGVRTLTS